MINFVLISRFHPSDPASVQYSSMVYIKPYCRMGPYLVGMFLAYFLYKKDTKVRIPKVKYEIPPLLLLNNTYLRLTRCSKTDLSIHLLQLILFGGWLIATTLGLALVYGNYGYYAGEKTMSDALNAIYGGFATTAWGLVVAWVLIVCVTGQGGMWFYFIKKMFSIRC